jgi:chromosome segregation protein
LGAIDARLVEEESRGIARAARRRGGRRVDEELVVEPAYRAAVEAILDEVARAYLVDRAAAPDLAGERGLLVLREVAAGRAGASGSAEGARERRLLERVADLGGGPLASAIRRDPGGVVSRVLTRAVVLPDLASAIAIQEELPAGWLAAVRDGSAVVGELTVRLGRGDAPLERRAEAERLRGEVDRLAAEAAEATASVAATTAEATEARRILDTARAGESQSAGERRAAEEEDRRAARALEAAVRETGWQAAQADRLAVELGRLREAVAAHEAVTPTGATNEAHGPDDGDALAAWEARASELRASRDRLAAQQADVEAGRREAEARRARAEAIVAMNEGRIARTEADAIALATREQGLLAERERLGGESALAARREEEAANALAELRLADTAARDRLAAAERDAVAARDRLRAADDRLRAADRADLEARLGRDALREQLLVELAGLGDLGLRRLVAEASVDGIAVGPDRSNGEADANAPTGDEVREHENGRAAQDGDDADTGDDADNSDDAAALESALAAVVVRWAASPSPADPPSAGRLATLRRRYHELGAANPYAVDEYATVKARLESLDTQQSDLRQAIERTRELIGELNRMIAEQFATTFQALETAFDRRFQQLFGGGFARLSLTDPADLSATGIEIVARPPGKKAQALAMLSGGERALTAVALLFAMLEVRPVPFCVLDEVDAALDEANVGRFTEALTELAARTQFIVITHNRGTIEAADALYGVTVGDDSVSRVISLKLDEAQALADRGRDGTLVGVS